MSLNTQGNVVAIRITNTSPDVAYTRTVYAPQSHRPADSLCYEKNNNGWKVIGSGYVLILSVRFVKPRKNAYCSIPLGALHR